MATDSIAQNAEESPVGAVELDPEIEVMMAAGVHLGHAKSKRHPAMTPYLWGVRNNVEIIDLLKTREYLARALEFLKQAVAAGKLILFVGTKPSVRDLVSGVGRETGYPYVIDRWIGGTLTNFKAISRRIEQMQQLEHDQASGALAKYTKREQLELGKELARLREKFDGLRALKKLPDVIVIIDINHDALALAEARRMKIPIVALTDTDTDPRLVQYPIPSNDDARPAIFYMIERMKGAIRDGRAKAEAAQVAADAAVKEGGAVSSAHLESLTV